MVGGEEALNESETKRWTRHDLPTPASYKAGKTGHLLVSLIFANILNSFAGTLYSWKVWRLSFSLLFIPQEDRALSPWCSPREFGTLDASLFPIPISVSSLLTHIHSIEFPRKVKLQNIASGQVILRGPGLVRNLSALWDIQRLRRWRQNGIRYRRKIK